MFFLIDDHQGFIGFDNVVNKYNKLRIDNLFSLLITNITDSTIRADNFNREVYGSFLKQFDSTLKHKSCVGNRVGGALARKANSIRTLQAETCCIWLYK